MTINFDRSVSSVRRKVTRDTWLVIVLSAAICQPAIAETSVDFTTQIAPILQANCVRCHSPGARKGDLSLATAADLRDSEMVLPGDPAGSQLLEAVRGAGGERPQMPKDADPLLAEQVDLLERWVLEGASWPEGIVVREAAKADANWWSLRPVEMMQPPVNAAAPLRWQSNPIDRFVFAKLAENGLEVNPPADRRTLIRRATYDLNGLPPSPEKVAAFVDDSDPAAYEKLIDRLLASPRYGERWGRHWLDVVRFGESNGFERNFIINDIWPFRDYVIESLNMDKPFDDFIREHLAGDILGKDRPAIEVGSAFLVAGPFDDVGNQDAAQAAQIRANTIDEMIRATSEAFLGLTIGCARCHDHKFDPILQRDYYSWYATFAGVRHGSRVVASSAEKSAHAARLDPLVDRRDQLREKRDAITEAITNRGTNEVDRYEKLWPRDRVRSSGTEERFSPVEAKFVRLVCTASSHDLKNGKRFDIDEFETWTATAPKNVALATNGGSARGASRQIEDFPGAYGPHIAIDGRYGERFLGTGGTLTIEFPEPQWVNRVLFSTAHGEESADQPQFVVVADYRIEISLNGRDWQTVATSADRQPISEAHRDARLLELEATAAEKQQLAELDDQIAELRREITAIPELPSIWVGDRDESLAAGPFHVFLGGSPQRPGEQVVASSLSALARDTPPYSLEEGSAEDARRLTLANWIVHPENPLTPRVLANRLWHYHFGAGIVDTPSDFGYMGSQPTHPELLDWLAHELRRQGWRLKPLHKLIMLSQTYQQSSEYRIEAAQIDGDARLLWRFSPRRLSAEAVRDTMLVVAGKLDTQMGGPGFRLYRFLQDNVSTYQPLDKHGPKTYRRAVYHQNARASVLDLMTDFDQPDCAFSTPKRAETTTPLQALTLLNHRFTLDMARAMSERLVREAGELPKDQIEVAFQICYARRPSAAEIDSCRQLIASRGLPAFCRVLLNTSELIYLQ